MPQSDYRHPQSRDGQSQEMLLTPSADKKTRNHYTECSNDHPFQSTLRWKRLSCSKMECWAIYANLPVNLIVRLPHPQSGDIHGQETFLAPSADKQTLNHDTECSNDHPSLSTLSLNGMSRSKMKWRVIYTNIYVYMYIYIYIYIYIRIYISKKRSLQRVLSEVF